MGGGEGWSKEDKSMSFSLLGTKVKELGTKVKEELGGLCILDNE